MLKCLFISDSSTLPHNVLMNDVYKGAGANWGGWWVQLCVALLLMAGLGGQFVVLADGRDHDRAERALQSGQIMSLQSVLQKLQTLYPGKVLEVELEDDDGRWIYEIKLLQTGGQLRKIKLDARTAEVLQSKMKSYAK